MSAAVTAAVPADVPEVLAGVLRSLSFPKQMRWDAGIQVSRQLIAQNALMNGPGQAIVVGQDTRRSGDMFVAALAAGATSLGVTVSIVGVGRSVRRAGGSGSRLNRCCVPCQQGRAQNGKDERRDQPGGDHRSRDRG